MANEAQKTSNHNLRNSLIFAAVVYGLSIGFKFVFFPDAFATARGLFFASDVLPSLVGALAFSGYLKRRMIDKEKKGLEKHLRKVTASVNNPLNMIMAQIVVLKSELGEDHLNVKLIESSARKIGHELNSLVNFKGTFVEEEKEDAEAALDVESASRGLSL